MRNDSYAGAAFAAADRNIPVYGGFWARLSAYIIDCVIVFAAQLVLRMILAFTFGVFGDNNPLDAAFLFQYSWKDALIYCAGAVYFVLCTYHGGATLGKKAMNLKVVSADGEDLTFLDVLYRETIGRFLSAFVLCIGYILVGVTNEKTGLHDILCDTRVVYAKKIPTYLNGDINKRYTRYEKTVETPQEPKAERKPETFERPEAKQAEEACRAEEPPVPPFTAEEPQKQEQPRELPAKIPVRKTGDIYDRYRHVDPNRDKKDE